MNVQFPPPVHQFNATAEQDEGSPLVVRGQSHVLLVGAVAVLWLATRPYHGIVHDSRLYTLLALAAADPGRFASDLFLAFGSQGRFTVFSYVYEPVLVWLGPSHAAIALTLTAHLSWLCGAYWLAWTLLRDSRGALLAVAGLVALSSSYGALLTFSFGESFLTPRLFAEALTMAALGLMLQGRSGFAVLATMLACAFHPVMALPGAAVVFIYLAWGRRACWAAAACAGAAACGLAALGVEPFSRVGIRFDPAWFAVVLRMNSYAFLSQWSIVDYSILASQAALAALAWRTVEPANRRVVAVVVAVASAGLGLTLICGDLGHNQLLTNLQPWRATWLLGMMSHLLAVPILVALGGKKRGVHPLAKVFAFSGIAALLFVPLFPVLYVWAAILLTFGTALAKHQAEAQKTPLPVLLLLSAVIALGVGGNLMHFGPAPARFLPALPERFWAETWNFVLLLSGVCLVALTFASTGSSPFQRASRWFQGALTACVLLAAVTGWDQRSDWQKFVEGGGPPSADLKSFLPEHATVYWNSGVDILWVRLRRPSYYSCTQGAGVMFFRDTAIAHQHRGESFRFDQPKSDRCPYLHGGDASATEGDLRRACIREPQLDYIVTPQQMAGIPSREWVSPVSFQYVQDVEGSLKMQNVNHFYRYSCSALRGAPL